MDNIKQLKFICLIGTKNKLRRVQKGIELKKRAYRIKKLTRCYSPSITIS